MSKYDKHFSMETKMNKMIGESRKPLKSHKYTEQKLTAIQLLEEMTLEEKINYISGVNNFCIRAIERLGIPAIWTSDTTSGVRGWKIDGTFFPAAVAMAASFDRELIHDCAKAIAEECRSVGISVLLGPGVNIARIPVCGRNFEYMGEDPYLAGEMAASYIKGAQEGGVVTTVKHFACNNSDYNRHKENAIVDERTLREIYLPAFEKAVKEAGTLGLMTSYNQVNGAYASQNSHLLNDILWNEWQYEGFVISDWTSLYDTVAPMKHGVDLEMPGPMWFSEKRIKRALRNCEITEADIDKKVLHMLKVWEKAGILNRPVVSEKKRIGTKDHRKQALQMAREAITLLKNDSGLLPLNKSKIKRIAILGYDSEHIPTGGGGSAFVRKDTVPRSLKEELASRIPDAVIDVLGWHWNKSKKNLNLVKSADVVIYCTGYDHIFESETYDRPYELLDGEPEGIKLAKTLNDNTVVILHSGGDCETATWIDFVDSVIFAYYLGDEGAEAITDVLLGKVNPSGHLPFTIAHNVDDYATMKNIPADYWHINEKRRGNPGQGNPNIGTISNVEYKEGLLVGYRWFDSNDITVDFPFGHGLSYTSFAYENLSIEKKNGLIYVSFKLRNTGKRKGAEVTQVYVHDLQPNVFKAAQALAGFQRVELSPKEERDITIVLDSRAFCHFDENSSSWVQDRSLYEIRVGSSSRDIRLKDSFKYEG